MSPIPFSRMSALSFHKKETHNHRDIPKAESDRSYMCSPSIPLMDIDDNTNADATHLIYQSKVYFGVADLNILLEFFNSLGSNLSTIN